jgi:DNA primase
MMTTFVDFADLKEKVSFSDTIKYLKLDVKQSGNQWRGACPTCKSGGDRALVITDGKGWFCFALKKGGDQIALVAHILDVGVKEAALELARMAGIVTDTSSNTSRTVPQSKEESVSQLAPLSYLDPEHDAVVAIGFDTDVAASLGIGYAPRGIMRGTVAVPIRDAQGVLKGYIGIEGATLPADFQSNVVAFVKRA